MGKIINIVSLFILIHTVTKDCIPTRNDLNQLKVKYWRKFGLQLGVELHILKKIEEDYKNDSINCTIETIDVWLNTIEESTYNAIITALVSVQERLSAQQLCVNKGQWNYCRTRIILTS